jgi:hypothetical protein
LRIAKLRFTHQRRSYDEKRDDYPHRSPSCRRFCVGEGRTPFLVLDLRYYNLDHGKFDRLNALRIASAATVHRWGRSFLMTPSTIRGLGLERSPAMLRKTAIALAAASLFGAASISTDALAAMRGGAGHGGFGGGGFGHRSFGAPGFVGAPHTFSGRGFVGHGFRGHRFARFGVPAAVGLGLGLGFGAYSYYDDPCYAWTPYGYRWVCGYDY